MQSSRLLVSHRVNEQRIHGPMPQQDTEQNRKECNKATFISCLLSCSSHHLIAVSCRFEHFPFKIPLLLLRASWMFCIWSWTAFFLVLDSNIPSICSIVMHWGGDLGTWSSEGRPQCRHDNNYSRIHSLSTHERKRWHLSSIPLSTSKC